MIPLVRNQAFGLPGPSSKESLEKSPFSEALADTALTKKTRATMLHTAGFVFRMNVKNPNRTAVFMMSSIGFLLKGANLSAAFVYLTLVI